MSNEQDTCEICNNKFIDMIIKINTKEGWKIVGYTKGCYDHFYKRVDMTIFPNQEYQAYRQKKEQ